MLRRGLTIALCCGVMLAAVVAWAVGQDLSSRYSYDTYDNLVGGSGIAAAVFALLALRRAGWACVPLVAAIAVSALMAYVRFSDPGDAQADLTPFVLPPVIFSLGGAALMMTILASDRLSGSVADSTSLEGQAEMRDGD